MNSNRITTKPDLLGVISLLGIEDEVSALIASHITSSVFGATERKPPRGRHVTAATKAPRRVGKTKRNAKVTPSTPLSRVVAALASRATHKWTAPELRAEAKINDQDKLRDLLAQLKGSGRLQVTGRAKGTRYRYVAHGSHRQSESVAVQ